VSALLLAPLLALAYFALAFWLASKLGHALAAMSDEDVFEMYGLDRTGRPAKPVPGGPAGGACHGSGSNDPTCSPLSRLAPREPFDDAEADGQR
jgi:hypothetical protein